MALMGAQHLLHAGSACKVSGVSSPRKSSKGKFFKNFERQRTLSEPNLHYNGTINAESLKTISGKRRTAGDMNFADYGSTCHQRTSSKQNSATQDAIGSRKNKYYNLYGRNISGSKKRTQQADASLKMLETTIKDSEGSSFFQTPQPATPIHEHFTRTDQILRHKPTTELWKSYEIDERKKIIRQLKEVNEVTNQQENATNKINDLHNKTYTVCERDRVRMSEFFTNEWINTLITKNPTNKLPLPLTLQSSPHTNLKNIPLVQE